MPKLPAIAGSRELFQTLLIYIDKHKARDSERESTATHEMG
jgi:hypothetical protein